MTQHHRPENNDYMYPAIPAGNGGCRSGGTGRGDDWSQDAVHPNHHPPTGRRKGPGRTGAEQPSAMLIQCPLTCAS